MTTFFCSNLAEESHYIIFYPLQGIIILFFQSGNPVRNKHKIGLVTGIVGCQFLRNWHNFTPGIPNFQRILEFWTKFTKFIVLKSKADQTRVTRLRVARN